MEELKEESEEEKKVGKPPATVWIKEPSPERLVKGKKTKYYLMPEGNFEKGSPCKCLLCDFNSKSKSDVRVHFDRVHGLKEKLYRRIECELASSGQTLESDPRSKPRKPTQVCL